MSRRNTVRSCVRSGSSQDLGSTRLHRQICLPISSQLYGDIWIDAKKVRAFIQKEMERAPELFPPAMIARGYHLTGFLPESKKLPGVKLRQVQVGTTRYYLRPSFVMGYMSGYVDQLDGPLFLLSLGVPPWAITRVFGRNDMYWHRHLERLGRNSLVGTTVNSSANLPTDIAADEHHGQWCSKKGYIGMTVGSGCILGIGLSSGADEKSLKQVYRNFQDESKLLDKNYAPQTVNTDGWTATSNAFTALFPSITVILCFLHGFLKIRDRSRKEYELHTKVWEVYRATCADSFNQAMENLLEWFEGS